MKRALSLIIVLAMVLCLVPFSAFAEGEIWGINGDFEDGTVTLNESNGRVASALYTAPEDGTVSFYFEVYTENVEGVNIYLNSSDEAYVPGTEIAVVGGQTIDVEVSSDNGVDCEVYVSHNFAAVPGTVNNPYDMYCTEGCNPTVILMPDESVYYNVYGIKGKNVQIYGEGIKVNFDGGDHFTGDEMIETFIEGTIMEGNYVPVLMKITNKSDSAQYYKLFAIVPETPLGAYDNPHYIWETGVAQTGTVEEGSNGYYYTYYAEDYGTATITVNTTDAEGNALGWSYAINNLTTGKYGDTQWSDSDPAVNPAVIEVSQGDEIQIILNTYDPANPWGPAPAGDVSVTVSFEADPDVAEYNGETFKRLSDALQAVSYAWPAPSAEAPAVVTLIGNAEVDSIVELDAYVTLDLADYTLTAPNVLVYENSVLTGNVGTAAINSTYVVANNVTIDGTEYAWTANEEGVYTLAEYKAPTVEDDEPLAATYNGKDYTLDQAFALAAAAYTEGGALEKVALNQDLTYVGTVGIPKGVEFDIVNFALTADGMTVYNGGMIFASKRLSTSAKYGKIIVPEGNLAATMWAEAISTGSACALPIYVPADGAYALVNAAIQESATDKPYTLDKENHTVSYGWKHTGGGAFNPQLKDGAADNGLRMCVKVSWFAGLADVDLNFWYSEQMVKDVANGSSWYGFDLSGLDILGANYAEEVPYDTFEVRAAIISDCGVCVFGPAK